MMAEAEVNPAVWRGMLPRFEKFGEPFAACSVPTSCCCLGSENVEDGDPREGIVLKLRVCATELSALPSTFNAVGFLRRLFMLIRGGILVATLSSCGGQQSPGSGSPRGSTVNSPAVKPGTFDGAGQPRKVSEPAPLTGPLSVLAGDWFDDVTATSGIDFTYRNGQKGGHFYILESLGGGAAIFDYDRDGNIEIFLTGGGTISDSPPRIRGLPSALFRNEGQLQFTDVTANARLNSPGDYSHGCFAADYNGDGDTDLFVTAYGRCRLFRNQGDGTFEDVSTIACVDGTGWWTAAAWGDVDQDGLPDLLVSGYLDWTPETDRPCWNATNQREVCSPTRYSAANDRFYHNRGDGVFEDHTTRVGLRPGGNGLGVVAAEINGDNFLDFYVANDETDNFYYVGQADGTLKEIAHSVGVAVNQYGTHEGSMGVDAGDYDGDGRPDLWVTNFELEDNALYRNLGDKLFLQTTNIAGLAGVSRLQVGFGTALEDFDGDGWLDLLVINGHVFYAGGQLNYRQNPQMFRNRRDGRFEDVSPAGGTFFRSDHPGRGAAVGDLDNDGGLDVVVVHQNEPATILHNRLPSRRFVTLDVIGTHADRDAVGAVVTVRTEDVNRVRFLRSGAGYFSQFDRRILMPVQADSVDVEVRWPGGATEVFRNVKTGRRQCLIQGRGAANAAQ